MGVATGLIQAKDCLQFICYIINLSNGQLGTFNVNETLQECIEMLLTCRLI